MTSVLTKNYDGVVAVERKIYCPFLLQNVYCAMGEGVFFAQKEDGKYRCLASTSQDVVECTSSTDDEVDSKEDKSTNDLQPRLPSDEEIRKFIKGI